MSFAQGHSDLKEYGYKGNVRQITTYNYDTLSFDAGSLQIPDTSLWRNKLIYKFSRQGNLDTIEAFTKLPQFPDTVFYQLTHYTYSDTGRFGYRRNNANEITDTIEYKWLTKTSYQIIETSASGERTASKFNLNSLFRDKAGIWKVYKYGKVEFGEKYVNEIDVNNRLLSSVKTAIPTGKKTNVYYTYLKFDKRGNAVVARLSNLKNRGTFRIIKRSFEYY